MDNKYYLLYLFKKRKKMNTNATPIISLIFTLKKKIVPLKSSNYYHLPAGGITEGEKHRGFVKSHENSQ